MSYQQEATTRIAYLFGAAAIAAAAGVVIAFLVAKLFPGTNNNSHGDLAGYSGFAFFATVCGLLVYKVDQKLNKRFNKNP